MDRETAIDRYKDRQTETEADRHRPADRQTSRQVDIMQTSRQTVVGWLLNVPATGECISGTDLLRQLYVLPHGDKSCRSNVLPHPVTVY